MGARLPSLYPAKKLSNPVALKVTPTAGLNRSKTCSPVREPGPASGPDAVIVTNRGAIVSARQHHIHVIAERESIRGIDAASTDFPVKIDTRIEGHSIFVAAGHTVGKRGNSCYGPIGIQITELSGLSEIHFVTVICAAEQ